MQLVRGIDPWTQTAIPADLLARGHKLGHATTFLYGYNGQLFLISNAHVFSGQNVQTGQALSPTGAYPDQVDISRPARIYENRTFQKMSQTFLSFRLRGDDGAPRWLMHRRWRERVDVAALPLGAIEADPFGLVSSAPILSALSSADDMAEFVGAPVYVIGFPLEPERTEDLPIWKRATIATEPTFSFDGKECFLVDTATRTGMSGSPVVARHSGSYIDVNGNQVVGPSQYTRFLGVYSGRLAVDDRDQFQLGLVWRRTLLDQICAEGVRVDIPLRG